MDDKPIREHASQKKSLINALSTPSTEKRKQPPKYGYKNINEIYFVRIKKKKKNLADISIHKIISGRKEKKSHLFLH